MATINDVQVVKFANERVRTLADKVAACYYAILAFQADYGAQGISAKITAAGASNIVNDGSDVDGRTQITGVTIQNFKAGIDQIKIQLETNVVGVGAPITTIANTIQVNGSPR